MWAERAINLEQQESTTCNQDVGVRFVEGTSSMRGITTRFCVTSDPTLSLTALSSVGLFANRDFERGDVVLVLKGRASQEPSRESIHVGGGIHVIDPFGSFVNHSFTPSCVVEGWESISLNMM